MQSDFTAEQKANAITLDVQAVEDMAMKVREIVFTGGMSLSRINSQPDGWDWMTSSPSFEHYVNNRCVVSCDPTPPRPPPSLPVATLKSKSKGMGTFGTAVVIVTVVGAVTTCAAFAPLMIP
jgi:hypothetical protein